MEWRIDAKTGDVKIKLWYDIFVVQTVSPQNFTVASWATLKLFFAAQPIF